MEYLPRYLEAKLLKYKELFPVLLVLGARQVGKSTLLTHLFGQQMPQVVFDPIVDIGNARRDPEFFLNQHPPPIILDEIQYAPELLAVIKRRVDRDPKPGQYLLTGSQNLLMLKTVSESLAGRVIIMELEPMALGERLGHGSAGDPSWLEALLASPDARPDFPQRHQLSGRLASLFHVLWRGGFPGTLELPDDVFPDFFTSYLHTYVERDVRQFADVADQQTFSRFVGLCAALTAQEINRSQLGRELGITPQTAARWLTILKGTYQWLELAPYSGNALKRVSGRPKGHLTDTGLACALQHISSPNALSAHPLLGALFETHVVMELRRQCVRLGTAPQWYHWRTAGGAEVDVVLERDGIVWPIEIRCQARLTSSDASGIRAFRATYPSLRMGPGLIIAAVEEVTAWPDRLFVIPYDLR